MKKKVYAGYDTTYMNSLELLMLIKMHQDDLTEDEVDEIYNEMEIRSLSEYIDKVCVNIGGSQYVLCECCKKRMPLEKLMNVHATVTHINDMLVDPCALPEMVDNFKASLCSQECIDKFQTYLKTPQDGACTLTLANMRFA